MFLAIKLPIIIWERQGVVLNLFVKNIYKRLTKLLWRIASNGVISIHLKDTNTTVRGVCLMGNPVFRKCTGPRGGGESVMYFKINRNTAYTLDCIQAWLDIADALNADYYFVCDNCYLKYKILNQCYFKDTDIKFISSKGMSINKIANSLYTGNWKGATHAHLTPFYHAKKHGIKQFWNIDADDTTILLSAEKAAGALREAANIAISENIAALSLDMWISRTKGRHWSFGVTFINDKVDYLGIFKKNTDLSWTSSYQRLDFQFNLDWFFTYLRDNKYANIKTFYIDDCMFIHWGDFIANPFYSWVNIWKNGKVFFPILENVFGDEQTGVIDNCADYKISVQASEEEGKKMLETQISHIRTMSMQQQMLLSKRI